MLARRHRLTIGGEFRHASRAGRRAGSRTLVVHLAVVPTSVEADRRLSVVGDHAPPAPRVGFVVSKAVGPAVVRNRVKRRLRHLVRAQLDSLPAGSTLVVRALPPAGAATSAELGADLERSLQRVLR